MSKFFRFLSPLTWASLWEDKAPLFFHKKQQSSSLYLLRLQNRSNRKKAKEQSLSPAFTIVELLIVVVVIAILAAISIVSYNGITNQAKNAVMAVELSQWKKQSEIHKVKSGTVCPDNFAFVYGNSALGTSDFCVAKYETKIQGNDVGTTAYASTMVPEVRASGTPWVNITQTNAIAEAQTLPDCSGCHLITEPEWMTIAADVLSVKYNWSGGEVGNGYIYQGHVNSNPGSALAASTSDTDALNGITGGTGSTSGTNSTRVLYLKSGDAIWDFSGNVWEWTQLAIGTPTLTTANIGVSGDAGSGFTWREYTLSTLSFGNLPATSRPAALAGTTGLSGITSWDSSKGIGRIYANYADTGTHAFLRGGVLGHGAHAGVLSLHLSGAPSSMASYIGFRVAR